MDKKRKLRTYRTFKKELKLEQYLISDINKKGRCLLTKIRSGTNDLRIETGRWKRPVEKVEQRVCRMCMSRDVENEEHFILSCVAYQDLRNEMFQNIESQTNDKYQIKTMSDNQKWQTLMNSDRKPREICEQVKKYIKDPMSRREKL